MRIERVKSKNHFASSKVANPLRILVPCKDKRYQVLYVMNPDQVVSASLTFTFDMTNYEVLGSSKSSWSVRLLKNEDAHMIFKVIDPTKASSIRIGHGSTFGS